MTRFHHKQDKLFTLEDISESEINPVPVLATVHSLLYPDEPLPDTIKEFYPECEAMENELTDTMEEHLPVNKNEPPPATEPDPKKVEDITVHELITSGLKPDDDNAHTKSPSVNDKPQLLKRSSVNNLIAAFESPKRAANSPSSTGFRNSESPRKVSVSISRENSTDSQHSADESAMCYDSIGSVVNTAITSTTDDDLGKLEEIGPAKIVQVAKIARMERNSRVERRDIVQRWNSDCSPPTRVDVLVRGENQNENKLNQSMPDLVSSLNCKPLRPVCTTNTDGAEVVKENPDLDIKIKSCVPSADDGKPSSCDKSDKCIPVVRDDKTLSNILLVFFVASVAFLYLFPQTT